MHLYLVIYKGISEWPVPGEPVDPKTYWANYQEILHKDGEPFYPVGVSKDAIFTLIMGVVVVGLAITVGAAHLGNVADPTTSANPRPDWYLIWYFALLALIPPSSEDYFIILAPALAFIILLLMPLANKGERHYSRRPWAVASVVLAAFFTIVLMFEGYRSPWSPVFVGKNQNQIPALSAKTIAAVSSPQARAGAVSAATWSTASAGSVARISRLWPIGSANRNLSCAYCAVGGACRPLARPYRPPN
jgi:ubiquinol-cytochrome c reductase cytochrome b subunit